MKKNFSRKFSVFLILVGIFGLFGLIFSNFDFNRVEASGKKQVKINRIQVSCGAGVKTFSGTANFQGDRKDHLVVKLDNKQKLDRHDEPSTWSFTTHVDVGDHKLKAYIYDRPDTNSDNHKDDHKNEEDKDEWSFEVKKCPKPTSSPTPSPSTKVNCKWSDWGSCVLEEGKECGSGTRTRTIVREAQNGGKQCNGSAEKPCKIKCNDEDECDEGDENCGNIEVSPSPSPSPEPTLEPTPEPTSEQTPTPSTSDDDDDDDDDDDHDDGRGGGGDETSGQVLGTTTLAPTGNAWTEIAQAVMALGAGMVVPATYILTKIKE